MSSLSSIGPCTGASARYQPDPAHLVKWVRECDTHMHFLHRVENNGSYSLLNKEVSALSSLLKEGQTIAEISNSSTATMVNSLVKPRLLQLKDRVQNAQEKIAKDPELITSDAKLEKKWADLGLPPSILEKHIDFARFLVKSGLVFKILTYRQTCGNSHLHDVKLDEQGHPMIKVQGEFRRWDVLKKELIYDSKTDNIRSAGYPGSIVQNWSYLSPEGLVPIDRLNHEKIVPIYQLTQEERARVLALAQKFYEKNNEIDPGIQKDWVVQFHTSPRRKYAPSADPFPENPLLDNFVHNLNTHIVMRLVAPNGDLYSFGVEMPIDSQNFLWDGKYMGTATAEINKTGDFEEFMPHSGRIVTSIPLSTQRADNILNFVNRTGNIRFNFLRQNCSNLAQFVLKEAGYDLPMKTTIKECLIDSLPDLKHLPFVGYGLEKVNQVFNGVASSIKTVIPKPISNAATFVGDVVFFIPRKIATFAINFLIKQLGGAMMLHALPQGTEEDDLGETGRFLNFSRIIQNWTDLFKESTLEVYHSKYFIDWQKEQGSTFIVPGSKHTKLNILPED